MKIFKIISKDYQMRAKPHRLKAIMLNFGNYLKIEVQIQIFMKKKHKSLKI